MIHPSSIMFHYICRSFFLHFVILTLMLLGLVFIFDVIEEMRRTARIDDLPLRLTLVMSSLRLLQRGEVLFPFAILFSAIYTCWKLNKTHEMEVIRAAGVSVWQFLSPMIAGALLFGLFATAALNPVSALLLKKYTHIENKYINKNSNLVLVSKTGIWLRQPVDGGYALIHAAALDHTEWKLSDVIVFNFDKEDTFTSRIDSPLAYLHAGYWDIRDARITGQKEPLFLPSKKIPTDLTIDRIEESFADPDTISFWMIPEYIDVMEEAGFPSTQLRLHFQSLLAQPFFFASMILLAATFSLRPPRFGRVGLMIALGIGTGFFVFFMESMLYAFGTSQKISVYLAAWTPAIVSALLGVTALLHLEDG